MLSAKLFSDIVRRTPAETVTVTVDEKNMATFESGYSRFSIIGIPAAEFPELPKLTDSTQISLPGNLLKSMIRQTLFAIAESDAKPIHQGLSLIHISWAPKRSSGRSLPPGPPSSCPGPPGFPSASPGNCPRPG